MLHTHSAAARVGAQNCRRLRKSALALRHETPSNHETAKPLCHRLSTGTLSCPLCLKNRNRSVMWIDALLQFKNTRRYLNTNHSSLGASDVPSCRRVARHFALNCGALCRVYGEDAFPVIARVFAGCNHVRRNDGLAKLPRRTAKAIILQTTSKPRSNKCLLRSTAS